MTFIISDNKNGYIPLVPFMPENPMVGYGYVPYQVSPEYFDSLDEAYRSGTLFPALTAPYTYPTREVLNYEFK